MTRGKLLDVDKQKRILILHERGESPIIISKSMGISLNTVKKYLHSDKLQTERKITKKLGRRSSTSYQKKTSIKSFVKKNKGLKAGDIKDHFHLDIGVRQTQNLLKEIGASYTKIPIKNMLSSIQKDNRLHFAINHVKWLEKWKNVIFTDEKKFNLNGPDGDWYEWKLNEELSTPLQRQ
jgi:transposase